MTTTTIDTRPAAVSAPLVRGRGAGGPAPKRTVVAYGFWIFILSDMVVFAGLFAAYAVLAGNAAGGPTGAELFNLHNVFVETMCLLLSSYTCGLGALCAERRQPARFIVFAALTFVLGAAFLVIECTEFAGMVARGAGPARMSRAGWSGSSIWWRRSSSRACDPPFFGACCAGAFSGTRSTSSGSA